MTSTITRETMPAVCAAALAIEADARHILASGEAVDTAVILGTLAMRLRSTSAETEIPIADLLDALDVLFECAERLCIRQRAPLTLVSTSQALLDDCRRFLLAH